MTSVDLTTICHTLKDCLEKTFIQDYCPNGLQVQGCSQVSKIISGVSANQSLIDQAIENQANLIIVHHGFFWKGESLCITGIKQQRIKKLLDHNISLIAYHLPLDLHPQFGNNIQLAKKLNISLDGHFNMLGVDNLGSLGHFKQKLTPQECNEHLSSILNRTPLHIQAAKKAIQSVAWCTGAAQDGIEEAARQGADAYISGEISERTTHLAKELNIHYFAAGHHATERYGIQALGNHLASTFQIHHQFIDIDNPV